MRPYRFFGLAAVLAATFAGQSLVGRTERAPADDALRGPFDPLQFDRSGGDVRPDLRSGRV